MFACADDVVVLQNFSYGDTPTPQSVRSCLDDILGRGNAFDISVYELSGRHDVRPLVVKTLLTYLELDGIIHSTGPFYSSLKFQPQKPSPEILERFDARRAEFLRNVFRHAQKGRTWFSLDVEATAASIGESRERIMAAISYLEEQGDLVVEASGLREGYVLKSRPSDMAALADSLGRRFDRREQQDIARVDRVVQFAQQPGCLTRYLLNYFGESRDDCGHCDRCAGISVKPLPPPTYMPPTEADRDQLHMLLGEGHEALGTSRQTVRFLCGLSSPATTRAKLRRHPMFGTYAAVPFHEVLRFVDEGTT